MGPNQASAQLFKYIELHNSFGIVFHQIKKINLSRSKTFEINNIKKFAL
jgi:hypothetical protein